MFQKWRKVDQSFKVPFLKIRIVMVVNFFDNRSTWCSKVLSSLSSVIQKTRSLASKVSWRLANTTNLEKKIWFIQKVYSYSNDCYYSSLLCHEGNMYGLSIQFCGHLCSFSYVSTIHKPKSGRYSRGKVYTIVDKCQGCWAGYIFPLGSSGAP